MSGDVSQRKTRADVETSFGKIPPSACDLEEAVLGALMLEKHVLADIMNEFPKEAFYKDNHRLIYEAILSLNTRNEPIDILTVTHELRRLQTLDLVGGPMAVVTLTNRIASTENTRRHVKIIAQLYAKREVIRICSENLSAAFEDSSDVFELFDTMDNEISTIKDSIVGKSQSMEWPDQVSQTVSNIEALKNAELKVTGIPTGSHKLDAITGGWQKSDLIIMSGRPGSGKSTRAINFIKAACIAEKQVVMFSLEMGWRQITRKFLNDDSEIYGNKLITGDISNYDFVQLEKSKGTLSVLPFHLNDAGAINPNYIRNILKRRKKSVGVDMVVIDYIQLMHPNERVRNRSRDTEVGTISTAIKNIAKEFDIPIIVLSQLSRKCEERTDKRPILSDLRESGSLENDADLVLALYRPSYYYDFVKDRDYNREAGLTEAEYKRIAELHILKHRNGAADRYLRETFFGEFSRFVPDKSPSETHTSVDFTAPKQDGMELLPSAAEEEENLF